VPFQGETPVATILKQLQEPPPLGRPEAARIPPAVVRILRRTLAKKRDERYASVGEFLDDWTRVRSDLAEPATQTLPSVGAGRVTAAPPPEPDRALPPERRRVVWWLGVPLVVLLGGGTAVVLHLALTPVPGPPPVVTVPEPPSLSMPAVPSTIPDPDDVSPSPGGQSSTPEPRRGGAATESRVSSSAPTAAKKPPAPEGPAPAPTPGEAGPRPGLESPGAPAPETRETAPEREEESRPGDPGLTKRAPSEQIPSALPVAELPSPVEVETGRLRVVVTPWAEVTVDGEERGTTPLDGPLELPVGDHVIRFAHPDYYPLQREVTIRAGETTELKLDLEWEGFRRN